MMIGGREMTDRKVNRKRQFSINLIQLKLMKDSIVSQNLHLLLVLAINQEILTNKIKILTS